MESGAVEFRNNEYSKRFVLVSTYSKYRDMSLEGSSLSLNKLSNSCKLAALF
jgi:hypothetical protein